MRLDVPEPAALGGHHAGQRRYLVQDQVLDLAGRRLDLAAPETDQVRESGMRAHGNAEPGRQAHRAAHDRRIAGVQAAGDVRRRHVAQDAFVVAELVAAERFADVAVEVDSQRREYYPSAAHGAPALV